MANYRYFRSDHVLLVFKLVQYRFKRWGQFQGICWLHFCQNVTDTDYCGLCPGALKFLFWLTHLHDVILITRCIFRVRVWGGGGRTLSFAWPTFTQRSLKNLIEQIKKIDQKLLLQYCAGNWIQLFQLSVGKILLLIRGDTDISTAPWPMWCTSLRYTSTALSLCTECTQVLSHVLITTSEKNVYMNIFTMFYFYNFPAIEISH
jgi:hypothetical protein